METPEPTYHSLVSRLPGTVLTCYEDAKFVCEFLLFASDFEKWKGMNVVNIGSVLNSKVRRRGNVKPGDLLHDMGEMLANWNAMTHSDCARLTGMFASLCRKHTLIAEYLDHWPSTSKGLGIPE